MSRERKSAYVYISRERKAQGAIPCQRKYVKQLKQASIVKEICLICFPNQHSTFKN